MNYLQIVSELTGVLPSQVISRDRTAKVSEARQLCSYFYRKEIGITKTGKILKRNHGTISYNARRVSELIYIGDERISKLVSEVIFRELQNMAKTTPFQTTFISDAKIFCFGKYNERLYHSKNRY